MYPLNGNLQSLKRHGFTDANSNVVWDDISYGYQADSNRLLNVSEINSPTSVQLDHGFIDGNTPSSGQDDYLYDVNGNLTLDRNKGITSISYNHLDLPTDVVISNGSQSGSIEYVYDATGTKLKKIVSESGVSDKETLYAGLFVYGPDGSNDTVLQFISQPEGYINYVQNEQDQTEGFDKGGGGTTYFTVFTYVFQYLDHLGNVRLSYSDNSGDGAIQPATEIIEESNYYPFGLKQRGYNTINNQAIGNDLAQQWRFNGMEQNQEMGLEWYDFGARNYEASIGRWMNFDPLAEKMRRHSPYNYAFNNPIYFIDPDGMEPTDSSASSSSSGNSSGTVGAAEKLGFAPITAEKIKNSRRI